jgi:S1-C subfamily serine protease
MAENERPSDSGWPQDRPSDGTDPWARPPGHQGGFDRPQPGYGGYGQQPQQPYTGFDPRAGYERPSYDQQAGYGHPGADPQAGYGRPGQEQRPGYESYPGYGSPTGYGGYGGPGGYGPGGGMPGTHQYPTAGYPYPYVPEYPRRKRSPALIAAIGLLLLAIPVAAGIGIGQAMQHANGGSSGSNSALSPNSGSGTGNGGATYSGDSASIAAAVDPGIVDINTTLGYQQAEAAGTGIVLTSNGEVLTNNHVINGATSISVTDIGNGKTYKANVVGYDRTDDIAVLQLVNASGLTTVSIGDSGSVKVGDSVVALGNAGGQGGTPAVAPGTVTDLNRSITASDESDGTSEQLSGLIEVNANVQPGDSGGPLVNSAGKVIGIDTAASTSGSGNFQMQGQAAGNGRGFAIPINKAMTLAKQIQAGTASDVIHIGKTAFLGVGSSSAGGQGGNGYGGGYGNGANGNGATGNGLTITEVVPGSPAAATGLTVGDTITSFNGQAVDSANTLTQLIGAKHPGDTATLGWTDTSGAAHTATVTLADGPAD